jgi:hypothetical protein
MKKIILTALLLTAGFMAQAQKNTLLVYGDLGINSGKSAADVKSTSFRFAPGVGYQFDDNWTAGVNLRTENWKQGTPSVKSNAFGAGPFIRYTYALSDIFAVFGQFNANAVSGKAGGVKYNGFQGELFPAIGVNLKNGFALNFNFGSLSLNTSKVKGASSGSSDFGLHFGSGAGFGISKNFGM